MRIQDYGRWIEEERGGEYGNPYLLGDEIKCMSSEILGSDIKPEVKANSENTYR